MRVLIIEDEKKVAKALRDGLEAEHYEVRVASTGEDGFFLVNHELFDLVLLDLMLPRRDGLEVLTTLRKRGLQTPVLILTASIVLTTGARETRGELGSVSQPRAGRSKRTVAASSWKARRARGACSGSCCRRSLASPWSGNR